jgi:hypothetical protein
MSCFVRARSKPWRLSALDLAEVTSNADKHENGTGFTSVSVNRAMIIHHAPYLLCWIPPSSKWLYKLKYRMHSSRKNEFLVNCDVTNDMYSIIKCLIRFLPLSVFFRIYTRHDSDKRQYFFENEALGNDQALFPGRPMYCSWPSELFLRSASHLPKRW